MKTHLLAKLGVICVIVGALIFGVGFAGTGFDISRVSTDLPYTQRQYVAGGAVTGLVVEESNADVTVVRSADGQTRVTCSENEKRFYDISESVDGTLTVKHETDLAWTDYAFNVSFVGRELTIEVPEHLTGSVSVKNGNGAIEIADVSADGALNCETSNGRIHLTNAAAGGKAFCKSSNGAVEMSGVRVGGALDARSDSGAIDLQNVAADAVFTDTSNGETRLANVSSKNDVRVQSANGGIELDRVAFEKDIDCVSHNGGIHGSIVGTLGDFSFDCGTSNGNCNLPENIAGGPKQVRIKSYNGDIDIAFVK